MYPHQISCAVVYPNVVVCVTHSGPVGVIVTGDTVARMPCDVSHMSSFMLLGIGLMLTVRKYSPCCCFSVASKPLVLVIVG